MTTYTPTLSPGSYGTLGYQVQGSGFGTASYPTAAAAQWITQIANTLLPDKNVHAIKTGHGTGTAERKFAAGMSSVKGDFTVPLQGTQGANLLAFWAGVGSDTPNTTGVFTGLHNHVITPQAGLRYLSMEDQWAVTQGDANGQVYRYHDVGLDQLDVSMSAQDGWSAKYSILGILDEASAETVPSTLQPTVPTFASPEELLVYQWGHVVNVGSIANTVLFDGCSPSDMTDFKFTAKRQLLAKYGGGSFYYTRLGPGSLIITGSYDQLFDSQAAAQEYADYITTTRSPQALVLSLQTGDVSTSTGAVTNTAWQFNMGLCYAMTATKKWTPDDDTMLSISFQVFDPWSVTSNDGFSMVTTNAVATAY